MDLETLGAARAYAKKVSGQVDVEAAAAAAERAESAAEIAEQHGYGFSIEGHTLVIAAPLEGSV